VNSDFDHSRSECLLIGLLKAVLTIKIVIDELVKKVCNLLYLHAFFQKSTMNVYVFVTELVQGGYNRKKYVFYI
jgi:hypothetical protein